jgi:hypothetical protein
MKGRREVKTKENAEEKTDNERKEKEWQNKEYQRVLFRCLGSERKISVL